uniref:Uncharacterized protein n=1 Tax=Oryza rufipogon TaxID=4529 RepID=A0A0E0Q8I2_ORYRU
MATLTRPTTSSSLSSTPSSTRSSMTYALSAGGGGQAELQKGAGKKACSCGSSQRQGQPGGGRWQRQGGIISITNV